MKKKQTISHSLVALALLLGLLAAFSPKVTAQGQPLTWEITCVDCPHSFDKTTDRSLRLDAAGHPHIAYGGQSLYYAWFDGSDWQTEVVDNTRTGVRWADPRNGHPSRHRSQYLQRVRDYGSATTILATDQVSRSALCPSI